MATLASADFRSFEQWFFVPFFGFSCLRDRLFRYLHVLYSLHHLLVIMKKLTGLSGRLYRYRKLLELSIRTLLCDWSNVGSDCLVSDCRSEI